MRFTRQSVARSLVVRSLVVTGTVLAAATTLATPAQADPVQHRYANVSAYNKCLDIRGGSTSEGALLQQFDCKLASNQSFWTDTYLGDPSTDMKAANSGLCLEPTGMNAGATIIQRRCNYSEGQRWEHVAQASGVIAIKNRATGLCLADAGAPSGSRREVRQQPCDGTTTQLWVVR
ncbi:RICIN domain-containing protein [Kitasatospora sp. NPDC127067]|uniref:RICIN domain-containing protein n=1 Tax=Kitasatospora sp. NPDC127067 TaxID=3347126 RepID=UPI003654CA73